MRADRQRTPLQMIRHPTRWGYAMREISLRVPELGLIAGTRAALGVGVGLLIADRLNHDARKAAGWALFTVGAMISIPIFVDLIGRADAARIEGTLKRAA